MADDLGTLTQHGDNWSLTFTRRLRHAPEKVWRAITEPEHLAAWFPDTIVVERWEVGAPLRFEMGDGDSFDGEVLAYEPPRLVELRWGTDVLRLEVEPDGDGTRFTLLDTLDELGKAARDGAGWHVCLQALEHHLDGTRPDGSTSERWRAVHPGYVEAFGPEASAIGPPDGALD